MSDGNRELLQDPRVYLAAERTLLAWVRTALALIGLGFVVARFGLFLREIAQIHQTPAAPPSHAPALSLWIGTGLIVLGVTTNILAALQFKRYVRSLDAGNPIQPPGRSLSLLVAFTLAALGTMMAIYLVAFRA